MKTLIAFALFLTLSPFAASQSALNSELKKAIAEQKKLAASLEPIQVEQVFASRHFRIMSNASDIPERYVDAIETAAKHFYSHFKSIPFIDIVITERAHQLRAVDDKSLNPNKLMLAKDVLASKKHQYSGLEESVLTHEICHKWLISYVNENAYHEKSEKNKMPVYGHRDLPDWFDEMIAVSCETGKLEHKRTQQLQDITPLETFFTQIHPVFAQIIETLNQVKSKGAKNQVVKLSGISVGRSAVDFYAQATLFWRFLTENHQKKIDFGDVAMRLKTNNGLEEQAHALGFASLESLQMEFESFVKSYTDPIKS